MTAPYYADESLAIHHGYCLDVLRSDVLGYDHRLGYAPPVFPDASVDAVVTDPPYGLGFMGKAWDADFAPADVPMRRSAALDAVNAGAARQGGRQRAGADFQKRMARDSRDFGTWCEQWAAECLRLLKPGGHLLAFGGTRTWHRLACAVEDAGFEVRDSIAWLYGSGFPKSLDVSKAIDRAAGKLAPEGVGFTVAGYSHNPKLLTTAPSEGYVPPPPATPDAERWQGWGTALKPAFEPIVVARRPLSGTVAANVLAHGTGALNVDGCRVGAGPRPADDAPRGRRPRGMGETGERTGDPIPNGPTYAAGEGGRWPTNVLLDGHTADELDRQSGTLTSGVLAAHHTRNPKDAGILGAYGSAEGERGYGDTGGASRFFPTFRYEAKAPAAERPRHGDTAHPTVKPLDLVRWLVRLVTPPGGLVLDPFAGSGTTAEACIIEGFRCITIEREAAYLPLITARLSKPIQVGLFGVGL